MFEFRYLMSYVDCNDLDSLPSYLLEVVVEYVLNTCTKD